MLVAGDRGVGLPVVGFEVGGGGVEEQQVHLQVEQVSDPVVDLLAHHLLDAEQGVHRPIARLIHHDGQAVDAHVVGDPVGRGQLRRRSKSPVGDKGEQDPLHPLGVDPLTGGQCRADRGADAQPAPQPVQHVRPAQRPGVGERHALRGARRGLLRPEQPGQGRHQPLDRGPVQLVFAAEGVQHLRA